MGAAIPVRTDYDAATLSKTSFSLQVIAGVQCPLLIEFCPVYLQLCCKTPTVSVLECRDRMLFQHVTNNRSTFRTQIV